jgi:hypothetical protein
VFVLLKIELSHFRAFFLKTHRFFFGAFSLSIKDDGQFDVSMSFNLAIRGSPGDTQIEIKYKIVDSQNYHLIQTTP